MACDEEVLAGYRWFYRFEFPDGSTTAPYGPQILHDNRLAMLTGEIRRDFGDDWSGLSCLDIACHQGWFAYELARRGMGSVLGVDGRPENIQQAQLIRDVAALPNLRFRRMDVNHGGIDGLDERDIVLMLGLIYHLEDPIGALRSAARLTRRLLVIETQVLGFNLSGAIDWGGYNNSIIVPGVFGIVDEPDPSNPENGITGLAMVPSRDGLLWLLRRLGFASAEVLAPPPDAYEQLVSGKRIVVAAWK